MYKGLKQKHWGTKEPSSFPIFNQEFQVRGVVLVHANLLMCAMILEHCYS